MHTTYLDGDPKVISIFYFWDEVLNPAGDLQQQSTSAFYSNTVNVSDVFMSTLFGVLEKWLSIHLRSEGDSLTVMMVSLKATISGFTRSRSIIIFSFPLMKPHFGAGGQGGDMRSYALIVCADTK